MATIHLESNLGIAPGALWDYIGNFAGVSQYIDMIQDSYLVGDDGTTRECVMPDGGKLVENLLSRDEGERKVEYTVVSGLPLASHRSFMQVLDAGDGRSNFRWITEVSATGDMPEFPGMLEGMLSGEVDKMAVRWP